MEKKRGHLFPKMLLLVFLIFLFNMIALIYKYGDLNIRNITGFSIKDISGVIFSFSKMSKLSQIFMIVQWSLLFMVLGYSVLKDMIEVNKGKKFLNFNQNNIGKYKTDLDSLYNALKKTKEIRLSTVMNSYKINHNTAIEWFKILETANLATIDYPGFGEPIIKIKEEKKGEIGKKVGVGKVKKIIKRKKKVKKLKKEKQKNKINNKPKHLLKKRAN